MTSLSAPQQRRLTSLFGLLALVAIAGALALNHSATAASSLSDPPQIPTNVAQQPKAYGDHAYTEILCIPKNTATCTGFLNDFNTTLVAFAGTFAILAFFGGAYTYLLSGGNEENIKKGTHQMIGSIVAFAIIVFAELFVGIADKLFQTGKPF